MEESRATVAIAGEACPTWPGDSVELEAACTSAPANVPSRLEEFGQRRMIGCGDRRGRIPRLRAGRRSGLVRLAQGNHGIGSSLHICSRKRSQQARKFGQRRMIGCGDRRGRIPRLRAGRRSELVRLAQGNHRIGSSLHICSRKRSQQAREFGQRRMIGCGDRRGRIPRLRAGRRSELVRLAQGNHGIGSSLHICSRKRSQQARGFGQRRMIGCGE